MSHSDRELLELAAKAYGIEIEWRRSAGTYYYNDPDSGHDEWDPLDNDGQALRLAAKLLISVGWSPSRKHVKASVLNDPFLVFGVDATDDSCADCRRAIVIAAAAIG